MAKILYGDYLMNAQGEVVELASATPKKSTKPAERIPEAYKLFLDICEKLEDHYQDMQVLEFTIEQGKIWMLQTRNGKRTAKATIKIAVDMANKNLITQEEAVVDEAIRGGYAAPPPIRC